MSRRTSHQPRNSTDQAIEKRRLAEQVEPEPAEHRSDFRRPTGRRRRRSCRSTCSRSRSRIGGDREREHEQRERARAQDHRAGGEAEQRGRAAAAASCANGSVMPGMRCQHAGGVRAEAEERAVAERDDAGVAEDEVQRQREQDEDEDARAERQVTPASGRRTRSPRPRAATRSSGCADPRCSRRTEGSCAVSEQARAVATAACRSSRRK